MPLDWPPFEPGAQAPHEDIALARAVAGEGHVGHIFDEVVDGLDVQLRQRLAVSAWIAIGTFCMFSVRRCAVTTTS